MTESQIIKSFSIKEKKWQKLIILGASLMLFAIYLFKTEIYLGLGIGSLVLGFIIVSFSTIIIYNCPKCHGIISKGQGVTLWPTKCPKCQTKLR